MLNRRLSDYLFYGTLVLIAGIIILLRVVVVGGLESDISELERQNIQLRAQIDDLEQLVQENKDIQTDQLYELYDTIRNVYSEIGLAYKTVAMLEQLGIDESDDYNRTVFVSEDVTIPQTSDLYALSQEYYMVRVEVTFTTDDITLVTEFIDALYNSEQLFIIDTVSYFDSSGDFDTEMEITYLAVYKVDQSEES